MQNKKSRAVDNATVSSSGTQNNASHNSNGAELHGKDIKARTPHPSKNSKSCEIDEEMHKQMVYLLIWNEMEKALLDKDSGYIPQFERQINRLAASFDRILADGWSNGMKTGIRGLPVLGDENGEGRRSFKRSGKSDIPGGKLVADKPSSSFSQSQPRNHSIYEKLQPEHITQILKNVHERDSEIQRQRNGDRIYSLVCFLTLAFTLAGTLGFLAIALLPDNEDVIFGIVTAIGAFAAGGLGGYGLHACRSIGRRR